MNYLWLLANNYFSLQEFNYHLRFCYLFDSILLYLYFLIRLFICLIGYKSVHTCIYIYNYSIHLFFVTNNSSQHMMNQLIRTNIYVKLDHVRKTGKKNRYAKRTQSFSFFRNRYIHVNVIAYGIHRLFP